MFAQGTGPLNTAYFSALTQRVNNCSTKTQLTALQSEVSASTGALQSAAAVQLAKLNPMLALLSPPTSPTAVITWAQSLITDFLTPMLVPAVTEVAKIAALTASVTSLQSAISAKLKTLP